MSTRPERATVPQRGELVEAWEVGLGDVILAGRYAIPAKVTGRDADGRQIVLHATGRGIGEVTLIRRQRAPVRRVHAATPPRLTPRPRTARACIRSRSGARPAPA